MVGVGGVVVNRIISLIVAGVVGVAIGSLVGSMWALPMAAITGFSLGFIGSYLDDM